MATDRLSLCKVLVTGANGFIGMPLCSALVKRQAMVRRTVRKAATAPSGFPALAVGNIDSATDWMEALHNIDVVIHLAARVHLIQDTAADPLAEYRKVNVEGTLNLARQALQAGVKRFILISSIKVNGEITPPGRPFLADDCPAPEDPYGISKREAENALRAICLNSAMEFVIIRPPLVYGPGVKGNFLSMMYWLDKGIPLPLASLRNKRSLLAVDNLVDLILTCIAHPAAANQIFLAADGEDLATPELLQRTAAALGTRVRLLPMSPGLLNFAARCLGKTASIQKLCGSLQVDIDKTREKLGWHPPLSVDQALRATAEHYLGVRK
ncbi:MAG: UDP-glucose 4-epimerase family protein [Methylomicrobium sp.]